MNAETVRSLITGELVYAKGDDNVEDVAKRLARQDVGAMPVCDADGRLQGMITDRDIVVKVVAQGRDPSRTRVGELTHGRPVTVEADAPPQKAAELMAEHQVRRLPVMDGSKLVGVVSQADVARALPAEKTGQTIRRISQ